MITPSVDAQGQSIYPRKIQEQFKDLLMDIFEELGKFGEIESFNVCDKPLTTRLTNSENIGWRSEREASVPSEGLLWLLPPCKSTSIGVNPSMGFSGNYGINGISPSVIGSYGSQATLQGLGAY
ncbi:hypothetical protein F0562_007616 [Nyssa sinensis]|uniref:Uncharacterized protein n=1 Tax=Nyssa sinensis TaxID=561372 RepID=A0A5J5A8T1_9ASTE|nr:hypothetical protein F0562_007616 [Nyssa sinensis]